MFFALEPRNGTPRCRAGPQRPRLFVASECAGESPLQGLTWPSVIRPWPAGPNPGGIRRSLPAQPVSGVGLATRQRRGAGGSYQLFDTDVRFVPEADVPEASSF